MNNILLENVQQTMNAIKADPEVGKKNFSARINWQDGVQNQASIGEFPPLLMDEPQPLGGMNKAPNPVEYLLAAAVGCFAITFEVLASQRGIALEKVEAQIEADIDAAVFLGIKEGHGGIQNPTIKLRAITTATEQQVKEIAQFALRKSPVLLSLQAEINLVTE
ncbi:OsmC family protein [Desulforamulus reducens MI-1]|uniref:OsmC family protein n=1 Tax=Desulforamulus reducens (strain ATCC BAA-1160 / DSM 100696 / MI-1) TaxID=349161 RepID=A4J9I0_DESRM|nr:OsmC family protein [Desulforamulus reducens]ABO51733.1 OsmC family protein [Desulforamulus reducens MI-1]